MASHNRLFWIIHHFLGVAAVVILNTSYARPSSDHLDCHRRIRMEALGGVAGGFHARL